MIPDQSGSAGAATTNTRSGRDRSGGLPADASVRVSVLGEIALCRADSGLAAVPGARARLLLAALALHPGRSRSAPGLIEDIWGAQPPRAPMNALHTQVSRLRSALPDGALEVGPAGYRLALGEEQVDLTLARRLERQAREMHAAGRDDHCLDLVARARALWRGEPGADLPPGSVADELAELAATRWHALDELELASREASGDLDGAVRVAKRIAAARPLDEPAHGTLMRLLAAAGRANEALEVFVTLRAGLVSELGADPGPALVELNAAILRGEPMSRAQRAPVRRDASPDDDEPDAAQENSVPPDTAIGLRAAPNPLLGRTADLGALQDLLGASRVTTVLGPGGTGKTRVANELGLRMTAAAPVALIELASVRAAPEDARAEVEAAISAALGVAEAARDTTGLRPGRKIDARQRLRDAVAARPMLLILDNCEHLIDAVAEVVADLVGACDQLTVLTTSRAPLEITAETVYPLPPLAIDAHGSPATDLFQARARAVRPSVRLDPEVVARLCRTLDGLPLAIELAAARVRTMSVEEIDARLEHRFTLLRSGDRTSPQRHRTLHAVIEWSWNLLDEPQRIALRRLCRFPAGFTFGAAEIVADGPDIADIAAAVDGLVNQSLLSVLDDEGGGIRYRMLETVREFGEEQLSAAAEADLVMSRMSGWAREFAIEVLVHYAAEQQVRMVGQVSAELDNLLAVLRHACDIGDADTVYAVFPLPGVLWVMRGAHGEFVNWSDRVLAVPPPPANGTSTDDLQVIAHGLAGIHLAFGETRLRDAARLRIRLRHLLRSPTAVLSPSARFIAELACERPRAIRVARRLSTGVRSGDRNIRWAARLLRANIRENAGDVNGSMRDAQGAMRDLAPGDVWGSAMLYQHLAQLMSQTARYREAAVNYRRSVDALRQLRSFDEVAEIASYLAVVLVGAGDLEQAQWELEMAAGFVEGGAGPDDPVLRPNHRRASVQVGWAELALAQDDREAGLRRSRSVLEMHGWPDMPMRGGPGAIAVAAGVLDAHVLYDALDAVPTLPQELIDNGREHLGHYIDIPQIGSVALAIGSYLLAVQRFPDIARELIALAPKAMARQDTPSMHIDRHLAHHAASTTPELMAEPYRRAARMGRRPAGGRIMALLEEVSGKVG
ncbi:BTAD domain-containing putative transcriptional regulator [Nocardia miyunensis]|uniref:BTAD domain-containing putative transcriptional regulator n=1 Tax=Nocardia miyunensis TaxID=282684 RepID=UPI00082C8059|nr:BTAD domain-containing putative transcriptional regulator [Nocardia miyunensis]